MFLTLLRFASIDLNNRNQYLTAETLEEGYLAFSKFYQRHSALIVKGDGNPDGYYVLYVRS